MSARKYYIAVGGGKHKEVAAEPVAFKGFEEHEFFIHFNKDHDNWVISEARSGWRIISAYNPSTAISLAEQKLREFKDKLPEIFAKAIEKNGLSPRYFVALPLTKAAPAQLNRKVILEDD